MKEILRKAFKEYTEELDCVCFLYNEGVRDYDCTVARMVDIRQSIEMLVSSLVRLNIITPEEYDERNKEIDKIFDVYTEYRRLTLIRDISK